MNLFSARANRNFTPKKALKARCRDCRDKRKRNRDNGEPRQMYTVICADCGKETEVPFEPKNDRPVYCRDCFSKHRAANA